MISDIISIYEHTLTYGKAVEYKFSNGLLIIYAEYMNFPTVDYRQVSGMYIWDVPIDYVSFDFNTPFLTHYINVHASPVSSGYMWQTYSNISKTKFNSVSFGAMYQSSNFDTMSVTITGFWK